MQQAEELIREGFAKPFDDSLLDSALVAAARVRIAEVAAHQADKEHAAAPNRHERRKRDAFRRHAR